MSAIIPPSVTGSMPAQIVYPESDGKPMADNTKQFQWIFLLEGNLESLFADRQDVFVSGNQNWYPVEGEIGIVQAPDTYVVFGRPKGHRSSYVQHEEGGVPMTVVFEVLSPSNTQKEMIDKFHFYDDHGVEEYYVFDPDKNDLEVYVRGKATLARIHPAHGHKSPRLGIRFDLSGPEMLVFYPDGRRFLPFAVIDAERQREQRLRLDAESRAGLAQKQAEASQKQAARLTELVLKLRRGEATPEELAEIDRLGTVS